LWNRGLRTFEQVFFGKGGRDQAAVFWNNAQTNCTWYPPNVDSKEHSGLVPVSLYGDDVQAYRNSDPGAVSVIGWGSDLAKGNDPMLQYLLVAVYSEYCSNEHTYADLLEALIPRFRSLCSTDKPWSAAGFRFVWTGVQGDLKWIYQKYHIRNFAKNAFCDLCNAVKQHPDPRATMMCFTSHATHVEVTHSDFCAAHPVESWPTPMLAGVRLERFMPLRCAA
jgi:hypothetical protein